MSDNTKQKKLKKIDPVNFQIGLVVSLVVQPFEVIRTSSITKFKDHNTGMMNVMKEIFKLEGVKGFWRGGFMGMTKSTISAGIFFTGIENFHILTQGLRQTLPGNSVDFLNACMTKTISTLVINPMNVIKTRFEVVGNNENKGVAHAFKNVYQKHGFKGYYKGVLTTLLRDVPWSGIQYATYKFLLESYQKTFKPDIPAHEQPSIVSLCAAISSGFAVIATYPFDNLRVRYQTHDMHGQEHHLGLWQTSKNIYHEEGVRGFYKGIIPRIWKKATSSALTWLIYELIKRDAIIHHNKDEKPEKQQSF